MTPHRTEPPTRDEALMHAARALDEATVAAESNIQRSEALQGVASGWVDIASCIQDREIHS